MKRFGLVAMIALSLLPLVTTWIAVQFILPDVIPIHAGVNGIDSIGSKYNSFSLAFVMAGCCALFTVMYAFMDKLVATGFTKGADAHGGRSLLLCAFIFLNVTHFGLLAWMARGLN